ncbi:MAG TPA: DUF2911 domain-containing protein [Vicinamibacterales bacterium]
MTRRLIALSIGTLALGAVALAQGGKPLSPPGTAAAQVGGKWQTTANGESTYAGGKWIEITYGRPIKRGRDVFGGEGDKYGKVANPDAPVWRAGANNTTQLVTEVPIVINGKTIAPGTYTMFIDLKPNNWTLIVSSLVAQKRYDPSNKNEIWGAYDYKPDKDIVRAKMTVTKSPMSIEQLTWGFADMSDAGGKLVMMWDKDVASVPFTVARTMSDKK